MREMTPKERVLRAVNLEGPDRIPLDLGSTNCTTITRKAYNDLKSRMRVQAPDRLMMENFQICEVDEEVLVKLGIDTRGIHATPPGDVKKEVIDEHTYVSSMGIKYHMPEDGLYFDMVEFPLAGKSIDELEKFEFPVPDDPSLFKEIKERAVRLHEENRYAIVGDMVETGIFEPCWYLRGFTQFIMDLMVNKEFAHRLMRKMLDYQWKRYEFFLNEVGEFLDVVFVGDDLATAESTIMSLATYREMVKPYQKEYFEKIKNMTNAKLLYHSCGNISDFIEDLIEIGVDALNPVQVSAMDSRELKERFGDRICFWGAIDTTRVLPGGAPKDVEEEVKRRIEDLGPEGYVLTSVHNIQPDVSAENVLAMFKAAKIFGTFCKGSR